MHRRQPLPRLWLMTDERQGDALWTAIARLPRGAGIVFRHHSLPTAQRRSLFDEVKRRTRRKHVLLLLAGPARLARAWGADGSHGRGRGQGLRSAPAHSPGELKAAERAGAALVFLSPVFPTRSHPGRTALGRGRFGALARRTRLPVIALGGVNGHNAAGLRALGAYGWAGIDAWS